MSFILGLIVGAALLALYSKVRATKSTKIDPNVQPWWTIIGVWPESKERFTLHVQADTAREAEDLAQWQASQQAGVLWVVGVFEDKINNADGYAKFVDPDVKATNWMNTEHGKI